MTRPANRRVRVLDRTDVGADVVILRLGGADPLPEWTPGAHVDVHLPSGAVRQYSLCGPAGWCDDYTIAVLRQPDGRGGSEEVHKELSTGTEISITGPRNRFALEAAERYVFVAGGIGITPLMPMIETVAAKGTPWRLVYGGRSRSSMAFLDRLNAWPHNVEIHPEDEVGRLDAWALLKSEAGAAVYVCGPTGLITAVAEVVGQWSAGTLHFERFSNAGNVPESVADGAFEVQLGYGGPVIEVGHDTSILQAVLAAGADVMYSCQQGTCGSCETPVLDGVVSHRDSLLSAPERAAGAMLICVSRAARGRLVLDITR